MQRTIFMGLLITLKGLIMDNEILIAKRYAQAFLNVFALSIDNLNKINNAIEFLNQHTAVLSLLKVPLLDPRIKIQSLEGYLITRFGLSQSFKKLITVLVSQKRSYLIIDVLQQIALLYQDQQGIEQFAITSSIPLNPKELDVLQKFLSNQTHHAIIATATTDNRLIAGIRMQSSDHQWEHSIRKQLAAIEAKLNE